jgi:hypothetical protein
MALFASRVNRNMMIGTEWQLARLEEFVLRELEHTYGWRTRERDPDHNAEPTLRRRDL